MNFLRATLAAIAAPIFDPSPAAETVMLTGVTLGSQRRRRRPPTHEDRLRRSGRWSPSMDDPHSEPKVHVRNQISGEHIWMTRADWDAPPAREPRIGDVIEYVNGWGQVTRRERI